MKVLHLHTHARVFLARRSAYGFDIRRQINPVSWNIYIFVEYYSHHENTPCTAENDFQFSISYIRT